MSTTEPTEAPAKQTVTVTVDGTTFEAEPGELLIKAAQDHGVFIPRFCWHERMKPVGMCRMCLVEVEGVRGYPPACTTPVADGMVVHTRSETVSDIQDGVLELLLVNHPLDCPVCDRGGECPLQDQTVAFGPGESRFVEEKRHYPKPIPLSGLVLLDRERCIQCARCTRFADEIAGDTLIDFTERGDRTQVLNFAEEPFDSYFSGNTVQICPVGALTASHYRFRARPWDLATEETSCTACAVQCRGAVQSSSNRLVRLLGIDSDAVNHGWLCDKGRYALDWVHADDRIREPHVREQRELRPVSWPEALDAAAAHLRHALDTSGPDSIAVLGGARGTVEDAYLWARLAKGVLGTDHVDAQLGDGLPADAVLGMPRATIGDLDRASAVVLLAPDLEEELPVLALRLRRAVVELGVPLIDCAPVAHKLSDRAHVVARILPGEGLPDHVVGQVADARVGRSGPLVVILGRGNLAARPEATLAAAAALAGPDTRYLSALRRGDVHGALEAGPAPGFLPGRVTLDSGREWFTERWGRVPAATGLDAEGILRAAVDGRIEVLVLLGADPVADFPDATLVRDALDAVPTVIAVDAFLSGSTRRADVFLPATVWGEKSGTVVNLEGRVQPVRRRVAPEGAVMDDWRIAVELMERLGAPVDLAAVDEVTDEIAANAPAFAGLTAELVHRAADGVVLPLASRADEIVWRSGGLSLGTGEGGESWEPIRVEIAEADASDAAAEADASDAAAEADASDAAADVAEAATETPAPPALHEWSGVAANAPAPPRDAYALRLVTGRRCFDRGRALSATPALAALAAEPVLRANPVDVTRIGSDQGSVRVTSARGSLVVRIVADGRVPVGVARFDLPADGDGPSELIDVAAPVTDLRVETVR
ncbi:MAG: NADH-quinone oxidoreductase subunit NuoG [Actinomycetota bacterium]